MSRHSRPRHHGSTARAGVVLGMTVVLTMSACGAGNEADGGPVTQASPRTPGTTVSASSSTVTPTMTSSTTTPVAGPSDTVTVLPGAVTEADNGTTVDASVGHDIVAVLHNTYWRFAPPAAGLTQLGEPVVTPAPRGTCLPGIGCGTVVARYRAVGAGTTDLRASRTTCGEALPCSPSQGSWVVHVRVR